MKNKLKHINDSIEKCLLSHSIDDAVNSPFTRSTNIVFIRTSAVGLPVT